MTEGTVFLICALVGAAAILLARRWADMAWIKQWAGCRGLTLLDCRSAFLTGWGWALRTALCNWPMPTSSAVYRVRVLDREGEERRGKLLLVRGMFWLRDHIEARWESEDPTDQARAAIRRFRETTEHE